VALIAATGMRSGEALGLRWGDLDAETKMLQVNGTKTESAEPVPLERTIGRARIIIWSSPADLSLYLKAM
jgi:integrase